jgi:hypothetical protein
VARTSRHDRGRETEYLVAEFYRSELWPDATVAGRSEAGPDILNVPVDIEVKARSDFSPKAWVQQSRNREPGGHVVLRLNGQGKESVPGFMVIRRLDDDTELLRQAGLGVARTRRVR